MAGGGGLVAVVRIVVVVVVVVVGASGCGLPQGETCRAYVTCQNAIDATVDTTDWEEGGRCWDLPDTARQCEARCQAALDALLETPDPPAVCAP